MINVENLTVTYKQNSAPTLRNIGFNIKAGEIFGFLGPSGAGKSTTQKVLTKLLPYHTGKVQIQNQEISEWKNDFYHLIGVGFELPNHYEKLTAMENLRFFSKFYEKKGHLDELLKKVGLEEDRDTRVEHFSKGMKMRLNFVRAIMHDPEILFFDEPTSGLDPTNARKIKNLILELKERGKTIFLTTHNMHDADELCNTVAFISQGEIKSMDAPATLKQKYGKKTVEIKYQNGTLKSLEFDLPNLKHNQDFYRVIEQETIVSIHTKEASLEDIFIKVTGESLI